MTAYHISEPPKGEIFQTPEGLKKFDQVDGTYLDEACQRLAQGTVVALGGLSLVGESGDTVSTMGIIGLGDETPEGYELKGWSLHAGHPEPNFRLLRYFDTGISTDDVLLPFPNTICFFGSEADSKLLDPTTDLEVLKQIMYFISQFISDDGPPEGVEWDLENI